MRAATRSFTYGDLGNALRKIRIDMKIPIDFEDGSFQLLGKQTKRCAMARIRYSLVDADQAGRRRVSAVHQAHDARK